MALWLLLLLTVVYAMRLWVAAHEGNTVIGGDFAAFYTGGALYRGGGNPYDQVEFSQALHSLRPGLPPHHTLFFLYPPPLFWPFGLLALLPYVWSFATLMLISTALYGVALWLLWRQYLPHIPFRWYAAPALLFPPFLHTILNGQLGALACLSLVGFVVSSERKYERIAGLSLALCFFKPPLLTLPVLALLFTRRWRTLGYLGLGCVAFVILSFVTGWRLYLDYLRALLDYERQTNSGAYLMPFHQYVDFSSQFAAWGIRARPVVMLFGIGLTYLLRRRPNYLAAVIGLAPIFSIYTASYDCIILIIPVTVLLRERVPGWKWLIAALIVTPLIAPPLAYLTTIQVQKFAILALVWFISRRP